jgi:hypothetical protein
MNCTFPLYNQSPVQQSTSAELISAHGHDLTGDVLLKSYSPFDEQIREALLQDISAVARKALFLRHFGIQTTWYLHSHFE